MIKFRVTEFRGKCNLKQGKDGQCYHSPPTEKASKRKTPPGSNSIGKVRLKSKSGSI